MKILSYFLYYILSLRYKIQISGIEVLKNSNAKFILPNHQAAVDPMIIGSIVNKYVRMVPVVGENYYNIPVLKQFFKLFGAVPVSDLATGSRDTNVLNSIFGSIIQALEANKTVLLYPAGQLCGQGFEKIFNKQSAWAVTEKLPENTRVIGVRISGLWGSMWSRAWIGKAPNFIQTLLKALFFVFINLFFFIPKRKITIQFVDITNNAIEQAKKGKKEFNQFLENFYNLKGEETCLFLKHFCLSPTLDRQLPSVILGSVTHLQSTNSFKDEDIPEDVLLKVIQIIKRLIPVDTIEIQPITNISLDLNIDSLGLVDVISEIEKTFKRTAQVEVGNIKTVADLCFIAMNKKIDDEELKPSGLKNYNRPFSNIKVEASGTIPEQFIKTFRKAGNDTFAYDKMIGTTSCKEFLLKAYVVAQIIKKEVPAPYVGIMLPALQSTTLLVAATYLAGKTPVMLNWTVGPKVLEHCVTSVNLTHILTAKSFFDKVIDSLTEPVKLKCVFFEQKVRELDLKTKIQGLIACKFGRIPKFKPTDPAVILFTSGSEALPKAVELTHQNILSNLSASFSMVTLRTEMIFLSFLPPFHSFGFTILTIFPLLTSSKIAYTPDPTDSREVLKIMLHTGANLLLGTPTFLKMLLAVASGNDLKQVQLAISGAESLPKSVIDTFAVKTGGRAVILEGYGITECSPVLTINTQELQKEKSVGRFIPCVKHLIVDLETNKPQAIGVAGMILVSGPNVFGGYKDKSIDSPFIEIEGLTYYRTGDLGFVDEDGYLFITGRLKRFIKIAGEMISLPALELALLAKFGDTETTVLAIEGTDKTDPPQIALFSTIEINLTEVNQCLKDAGFSNLSKVHKIISIEAIPLLGTGKVDYKILKSQI